MNSKMPKENKILALSNDIAEYPPTNLSTHEWQALIVLSSVVNSRERPILGIDDVQEIARERGLTTKAEQNQLLNELIGRQNRYEMTYDEFFGYYDGEMPLNRKTKRDILKAMESLSGKNIVTANTETLYASFNWFGGIIINKKDKVIKYSLGQVSKALLMGLKKKFLQMMVRLSVNEAKKYDIPIFIHMKSKLHNKRNSFSWTEPLPKFQKRFGHDKIRSYSNWKDYYRRVLSPAEAYSLKSGDAAFKFEGKVTKGRKVTHILCKVWRIGNIHALDNRIGEGKPLFIQDRKSRWATIEQDMTVQQHRGYEFLKSQEINYGFLLDECMLHDCLKHELIIGYEDLFLKLLWKRFSTYTKAKKKGGAFVTWWRRGLLTKGDHYWATVEALSNKKKAITQLEMDARKEAATMNKSAYNEWRKATKNEPITETSTKKRFTGEKKKTNIALQSIGDFLPSTEKIKTPSFDYTAFKTTYPEEHQTIENDIFKRLEVLYHTKKEGSSDINKVKEMKKKVLEMLPDYCENWYREHIIKRNNH